LKNFNDTDLREKNITIIIGFRITEMALSDQSDFMRLFFSPASHLLRFCRKPEWLGIFELTFQKLKNAGKSL
jgi:hypothetical protein